MHGISEGRAGLAGEAEEIRRDSPKKVIFELVVENEVGCNRFSGQRGREVKIQRGPRSLECNRT